MFTSLGLHYFPDETHYRAADLHAWLPELNALGVKWLTLVGSFTRAVPEAFIKGLLDAGITPILHIPAAPVRPLDVNDLDSLCKTYARWGVKYLVLFHEPNTRTAWPSAEWGKAALVDRFLDIALPIWQTQLDSGLIPVFPALKAGGDYWDTGFLEAALVGLARRNKTGLAQQLIFAVNLWAFDRPVDWGAGGFKRWPEARPYLTPPGTQDQIGFHLFDWYTEIIRARLGSARPLLCLAGGPRLGEVDELRHESCTKEIVQAVTDKVLPENLLNINFWLLAAAEASPFAREAWYRHNGTALPAVQVLKSSARPEPVEPEKPTNKPLRHYLLIPTFEWGISEWHWQAALEYVKTHRPTCGFSADEARTAQRVTILGNEQGVSREVETDLRQAGCEVERIQMAQGNV